MNPTHQHDCQKHVAHQLIAELMGKMRANHRSQSSSCKHRNRGRPVDNARWNQDNQ